MIKFLATIIFFVPGFVNGFRIEMRRAAGDFEGMQRLEGNWIARTSKKIKEMS